MSVSSDIEPISDAPATTRTSSSSESSLSIIPDHDDSDYSSSGCDIVVQRASSQPISQRLRSAGSKVLEDEEDESVTSSRESSEPRKSPRKRLKRGSPAPTPVTPSPSRKGRSTGTNPFTTPSKPNATLPQSASKRQLPIRDFFSPPNPLGSNGSPRVGSSHKNTVTSHGSNPEHQNKRRRVEQPTSHGSVALELDATDVAPSETPLSDPVIRVHVENKVFELQLSRLVFHSKWFSRQFHQKEKHDTHIVLTNVSACDFGNLVEVLDRTLQFFLNSPSPSVFLSILHVAEILEFESVITYIIQYLANVWSSDPSKISSDHLEDAAVVLQIAREFKLPQLLQRAFYEVVRDKKGIIAQELSDTDNLIALRIQASLQREWALFTKAPPQTACDKESKEGPNSCSSRSIRRDQWTTTIMEGEDSIYEKGMEDPFCGLDHLSQLVWKEQGYCASCATLWLAVIKEKKTACWNSVREVCLLRETIRSEGLFRVAESLVVNARFI
ncbi:hypothetical protein QCA50_014744 [Cerrena zonata]|uniref:BTB domain-containing protein n=1 Tax=Cerrena zonata TaxID=2478898 RepID=A0AAW0FS90_9APHY